MAAVLPLYTAHPERPEVWAALEEFKTHLECDLMAIKAWEGGLFQGIDLRPILGTGSGPSPRGGGRARPRLRSGPGSADRRWVAERDAGVDPRLRSHPKRGVS